MTIPAGGSVSFGTTTSAARYGWVFPGGTPAKSTVQNPGAVTFSTPGTYVVSLTVVDANGLDVVNDATTVLTAADPFIVPTIDASGFPTA